MLTLEKNGNNYDRQVQDIRCLSTDTKPLNTTGGIGDNYYLENGATIFEIDTGNVYMFDYENDRWIMI